MRYLFLNHNYANSIHVVQKRMRSLGAYAVGFWPVLRQTGFGRCVIVACEVGEEIVSHLW